jgi:4-hydroxybenzoate polyprenyltransferase
VLRYLKEAFIALVVTIGFVVTPLIGNESTLVINQLIYAFIIFYFINLSNLLIFSSFDKDRDQKDNMITIAHLYSLSKLRRLIYFGIGTSITVSIVSFSIGFITGVSFFVFMSMHLTLLGITIYPSYFRTKDRYRFFGDLIYLYPFVVFPFLG